MSKPLPRVVPSDDCVVHVDGATYHPHEGETVTVLTGMSVGELRNFEAFKRLGVTVDAARGEADEADQVLDALGKAMDATIGMLARRVVAWTWTDDQGRALPTPDGNPAAFDALREDELTYLIGLVRVGTPAETKNA